LPYPKVFETGDARLYLARVSDGFTEGSLGGRRRLPPFTIALIALNVAAFLIQEWLERHAQFPLERYGALSLEGLRHGYVWQFISFQFLHAGWIHLLLNCWGIFVFGPPLEATLGKSRLAALYFLSGVAGGALQVFASILSYARFGGPVVGASAGVFGLVAAFTSLFPDARMTVLLFFVIPVRMTANRMLTVAAAITVIGIVRVLVVPVARANDVYQNWLLGAHVAHAAHLGGLIAGLIFVRLFMRRFRHSGSF
jgi:membrane associated rhomboid family serine protease